MFTPNRSAPIVANQFSGNERKASRVIIVVSLATGAGKEGLQRL
jgi:hypothetical protein